jgi:hypothetical protein
MTDYLIMQDPDTGNTYLVSIEDTNVSHTDTKPYRNNVRCNDMNVENVVDSLRERATIGLKKYGVTTERTDIDLKGWIQHAQEEVMDLAIYLERIKKELN